MNIFILLDQRSNFEQIAVLSVIIPASDPTRQARVYPVFAAYLPDKKNQTYVEYWSVFLKMAPSEFIFEKVMFDGELTLQSSLDQVFPNTQVAKVSKLVL